MPKEQKTQLNFIEVDMENTLFEEAANDQPPSTYFPFPSRCA
jgi:hypothetical protein